MNKIIIGKKELLCVLINLMSIKLFLVYPRAMVMNAGNAAWIQALYVSIIAILVYILTVKIYTKCGQRDVLDLCEKIGGKVLQIIIGVILSIALILNVATTVRVFPESIKIYLLPNTPVEVVILFLALAVSIGAYIGIEAISRLHAIFIPFAGTLMVLFFLLVLPYTNINNIMPILGEGPHKIFIRGFNGVSIFSDIILLNILLPFCKNKMEAGISGYKAIIISSFVAVIVSLIYCMIYPYPVSSDFIMPVHQIVKMVKVGQFFQRLEAIFEFIWSIATIMYISVYVYSISIVWKKIFDLKYHRPIILPTTIIISAIAIIPSSIGSLLIGDQLIKLFVYPIMFLLPIVISSIYLIKKKKKKIG